MLAAEGSAGFSSVEEMQRSKCETILGFHLGKKKKGQLVKQILLKVSSSVSQITIERVKVFPPFPVARIQDLNRFFVSLKSTNQPHLYRTLRSISFFVGMLYSLHWCQSVPRNISWCKQQLSHSPAGTAVTSALAKHQQPGTGFTNSKLFRILLNGGQFAQSVGRDCVNLE